MGVTWAEPLLGVPGVAGESGDMETEDGVDTGEITGEDRLSLGSWRGRGTGAAMGECLGAVRGQGAGLMILGSGSAVLLGVEVAAGGTGIFSGVGGDRLGNMGGMVHGDGEQ